MFRILTALALLIGLSVAAPARAATQWVMGYYLAYQQGQLPPSAIDWNGLTHIIMGRVKANADGTLDTGFDIGAPAGPNLAIDVANRAHAAGRKAILMLGGDDNSPVIHDAVANHMAIFVANLVAAMNAYGYDGLDLDWENTIDWDLFVSFTRALRAAAPNAILTLPTGTISLGWGSVDPHYPALVQSIDRLTVMAYYPTTSWAGAGWLSWFNSPLTGEKPATPVSIASTLQAYANAGVPKEKLAMGTSFYATCYTGGIFAPNQNTENNVAIAGGDNVFMLSQLYGTGGDFSQTYRHWWAPAAEPYLSLPTANSFGCRYISFEDEQSLVAKGQYSIANGYGGTILWGLSEGYVASHSQPNFLMEAVNRGFLNPGATPTVGISIMQANMWLNTGAHQSFSALVTGTTNTAVTWAVVGQQCGSIDAYGNYTAPAQQTSCTVTARSAADTSKLASASVTVSNVPWNLTASVSRYGTNWIEVVPNDPAVTSLSFVANGSQSALWVNYIQYQTNYPDFATTYRFPDAGGTYPFTFRSLSGRVLTLNLTVPACHHGSDGICH